MRKIAVGLAALMAFAGPAMGETVQDEVQDEEQPGSEIEIDIGGGKARMHRENGEPLLGMGEDEAEADNVPLEPLDDPDDPIDEDPIDEELPGEGPESLSGPDDEDSLPY